MFFLDLSQLNQSLSTYKWKFQKYLNSVFSLFAVTGNTIALRVMLTFNCLLLLVVVSIWSLVLVRADDGCLNEDMHVPELHPCYLTCEDYLMDKVCLKIYRYNDERTCYCKSPESPNLHVLTLDGDCILMEECIKLYGPQKPSPYIYN